MTLVELLEAAATDLPTPADRAVAADGSIGFSEAGTVFAALDPAGRTASFRLDEELAGAARRTPDTAASPRGPAWVAFTPSSFDAHAADRARAWFVAAHRRATRQKPAFRARIRSYEARSVASGIDPSFALRRSVA